MPKIFSKDARFNIIVYGEQYTGTSWQAIIHACFGRVKKVLKSS
jgi:hypothetical protein